MIPEKSIREEKFAGHNTELAEVLREIPMTERQRNLIQRHIDMMESIFREANNPDKTDGGFKY